MEITQMEEMGARLKEERIRLGMNQDEMAALAGMKRMAQLRYEKGERSPDGLFFAAAARAGVDVQYVITGIREGSMDAAEAELLARFRATSGELRAAALAVLTAGPAVPGGQSVKFGGDNLGQVMSGEITQGDVTFNVGSRGTRTRRKPSK
ncbi:helix-turn-helix transcriptional regulator [Stenotrophomonas sp. Iso1]|uniref:helix-turn-helix domain-containing protein n=1 Tax=Stenotrophomonas sp. Iso1 TaxID=2977283 RepID=UPI0022B78F5A|nr:helix-turn-helix transcriptional regulator [Stenotrophomonas sp. Iso1]